MRGAMLQLPEILLGIVPGLGGMVVPYRRWPKAAAAFHFFPICPPKKSLQPVQVRSVIPR